MSATQTASDIRKARAAADSGSNRTINVPSTPNDSWTVAQLKDHAATAGVELGDATKKDDILAVLTDSPKGN